MTEKITFHLSAFDGPLDLLLHLIAKNKVNIYDIPISLILEQYMEILREAQEADMEVAGDFIAMAAQLMLIKSRMLLPKEKNEEDEEEDPRAMLVEQLLEYQRIREVQPYFKRHSDVGRDILTRPPEPIERKKTFEGTLPPEKLSDAARRMLTRIGKKCRRRSAPFPVLSDMKRFRYIRASRRFCCASARKRSCIFRACFTDCTAGRR